MMEPQKFFESFTATSDTEDRAPKKKVLLATASHFQDVFRQDTCRSPDKYIRVGLHVIEQIRPVPSVVMAPVWKKCYQRGGQTILIVAGVAKQTFCSQKNSHRVAQTSDKRTFSI